MPARTRSPRAPKVSIHDRVKAHVEATLQCERWAKKALEHQQAGRNEAALAAYEKAKRYLATMKELEA